MINNLMQIATLTVGPEHYVLSSVISTKTLGYDILATAQETCVLGGTTAATCTATIEISADGTKTSTKAVMTLAGTSYHRFDVQITGGAEKLVNPTATCASKNSAASFSSKNAAIWALAGVMGVASVLSM